MIIRAERAEPMPLRRRLPAPPGRTFTVKGPAMWYAIVAEDTEASLERRRAARAAHVARLHALQEEGRLLLAGPFPAIDAEDPGPAGFTGSLIVAAFDSLPEAEAWAQADPYMAAGVYARVTVRPLRVSLPA